MRDLLHDWLVRLEEILMMMTMMHHSKKKENKKKKRIRNKQVRPLLWNILDRMKNDRDFQQYCIWYRNCNILKRI